MNQAYGEGLVTVYVIPSSDASCEANQSFTNTAAFASGSVMIRSKLSNTSCASMSRSGTPSVFGAMRTPGRIEKIQVVSSGVSISCAKS